MLCQRPAAAARVAALALLILLATLGLNAVSARATVVLVSTSAGQPGPQDPNLYDWRGQWASALDRNAPLAGQRPPWQVNVGLYGDLYQPVDSQSIEPNPTCELILQMSGAPPVQTTLDPCVLGPLPHSSLVGAPPTPQPNPLQELLTPDLAAAGNGQHTVTVTAIDLYGGATSATSFTINVDNVLPAPSQMSGPVGWQRGGEVITSTASTAGPSGISGQTCQIGSDPAAWYPGATAQLAVTGNGTIPVRCSAQNGAGVAGPTTEVDAMLDNTPPTGYFAPRNPNNPDQAVVDVADALSGVAGGQIQIQTPSGWQNLATGYSATTGQLTATIPDDGSLPDGNYAMRALVSDAVGNTATITADQDATPEVITVPLRIVTQLPVGRTRALVKRCTVTRIPIRRAKAHHQRPAARLVRQCTTVPVPRHGRLLALKFGQQATVTGLLETADGTPIPGAQIQVGQQAPGWTSQTIAAVTTDSQGQFAYTIPAGPSRTITFSYPGSATLRASASTSTVRVQGKAQITVSRIAQAGHRLRISGRVLGGYVPPGGVLVQLQYRVAGVPVGWAPFANPVRTDSAGRWQITFPLTPAAAGYTYLFSALIASQSGWPYLTTHSNVIARPIR